MDIVLIIFYSSMFVYLFPPIRQYGGNFFYFFLVIALADPLTFLLRVYFQLDASNCYVGISILMYFAVQSFRNLRINKIFFALILIAITYLSIYLPKEIVVLVLFIIHIFIFSAVLKLTGEHFVAFKEINLFFILLMLYELNAIVKFVWAMSAAQGAFLFYFTGFLNIPIGILFSFVTVKSPLWKYSLSR